MRITMLGGGNTAFSLAAKLSLHGPHVLIRKHPGVAQTFAPIQVSLTIHLEGPAPSGALHIEGVTTDSAAALAWAEPLICSVPSYAHSTCIEQLAPHLLGIATPVIDGLVTLTSTVGFDCSASRRAFTPEQIGRAQTHV